jgi:thioredoxin reductase (NADPH)
LNVTVVGAGNSAADAALDLYRHGVNVTLVHRGPDLRSSIKYWVRPDLENRIKEGSIKALFDSTVLEISHEVVTAKGPNGRFEIPTDFTFILTGYRPQTELLEAAGIQVDADGCVPHDQDSFETRDVPGLYVVGSAAFGKFTNQVFIENGREHAVKAVHSIKAKLESREVQV